MGPVHDFSYEKKHEFIGVVLDFFAAEPIRKLMYEGEFSSDESSSTSNATSCFLFLTEGESLDQLWSVAGCCLLGYCSDCLEVNPVQVFSFSRFFRKSRRKGRHTSSSSSSSSSRRCCSGKARPAGSPSGLFSLRKYCPAFGSSMGV